jgi:hypothetical protein
MPGGYPSLRHSRISHLNNLKATYYTRMKPTHDNFGIITGATQAHVELTSIAQHISVALGPCGAHQCSTTNQRRVKFKVHAIHHENLD